MQLIKCIVAKGLYINKLNLCSLFGPFIFTIVNVLKVKQQTKLQLKTTHFTQQTLNFNFFASFHISSAEYVKAGLVILMNFLVLASCPDHHKSRSVFRFTVSLLLCCKDFFTPFFRLLTPVKSLETAKETIVLC